jgi:hypothetical protein
MPRGKKTGKPTKNQSQVLQLNADLSPYDKAILAGRDRYRKDLRLFCGEQLSIVNKDAAGGDSLIPFQFNECQAALHNLIESIGDWNIERSSVLNSRNANVLISRLPIEVVVLKARKVGVSTYLEARAFWWAEFNPNTNVLVMAHERDAAQNIADIAHRFDVFWNPNTDPPIRSQIVRKSDDLIEWASDHDSRFIVQTAGARGGGSSRSFTYRVAHFSEMAFYAPDSPQVASALRARARYHETYFESTANGEGNMFHDEWVNALYYDEVIRLWTAGKPFPKWWNGKFKFFWPWYQDGSNRLPLMDYESAFIESSLDEEEKRLIEEFEVDTEQLAWRRSQIAGPCRKQSAMLPEEFFRQEDPATPEEAFVAKSQAVFDAKKLNYMLKKAKEQPDPFFMGYLIRDSSPEGFKFLKGGVREPESGAIEGAQFVQWDPPKRYGQYVAGADSAEGLEHGDWSVLTIFERIDAVRLREVARYRAKTPARELAEIAYFLCRLYNNAYLVPERNPPGNAMCEKLVELGYNNMFHYRNIEVVSDHDNPQAFTAGFKTTVTTKPMLVNRGFTAIRDDEIWLRSVQAIKEWKIFANIDGKFGAPDKLNDDCVMADLLGLFGQSEAPPFWVNVEQGDIESPSSNKSSEELQQEYWQLKIAKLRDKCQVENQKREAMNYKKAQIRSPFA